MSGELICQGGEWVVYKEQSKILYDSGLLPPHVKNPQQALTIMLMGRELQISPMAALNNISVVSGKPCMEAKLMLALVFRSYPNAHYRIVEHSDKIARVELGRTIDTAHEFEFTWEDATKAGLVGKDNWKKYPKNMLLWRAVANGVRETFPEVILNAFYTPEEMETINVTPQTREEKKAEIAEKYPPMINMEDEIKKIVSFVPPKKIDPTIEAKKEELILAVQTLADRIDFKAKTGKSAEEYIDRIKGITEQSRLDAAEAVILDLEMNT